MVVLNHATAGSIAYWKGSADNITDLRHVMEVTFTSHVILASDAIPHLIVSNGSLAVITSVCGTVIIPILIVY